MGMMVLLGVGVTLGTLVSQGVAVPLGVEARSAGPPTNLVGESA